MAYKKTGGRSAELEAMKLYTLSEIEPIIGVTHRTLLTYIKDKRLEAVKVGNKWMVSKDQLSDFINNGR